MKLSTKRLLISSGSTLLNVIGLAIVNRIFGFEAAVLYGIANIISTIDSFGYTREDK